MHSLVLKILSRSWRTSLPPVACPLYCANTSLRPSRPLWGFPGLQSARTLVVVCPMRFSGGSRNLRIPGREPLWSLAENDVNQGPGDLFSEDRCTSTMATDKEYSTHQERSRSLLSASFFSMISPAKFGRLGVFYFCEVGTGLLKVVKSARKLWEASEVVRSALLK